MRLGLTYNLRPADLSQEGPIDRFEEFDSEETVDAIAAALGRSGHHVERLGWGPDLLDALGEHRRLDGVFNFAEGIGGRGRESQVPAMLEMLGIPNTGSDPVALALALDKGVAKLVATAHGIATAPFALVGPGDDFDDHLVAGLRYPLFAKPVAEGSSMGIRDTSVCRSPAELRALIAHLQADYGQSVLVEEYLPGAEYTVGVLGNGADAIVVGVMQVVPRDAGGDFVYSLEVKRDYQNRVVYRMTDELLRRGVDPHDLAAVRALALAAHRAFGCRDVSRVDIRCDRDGAPNFLEINPLPGLNPETGDLVVLARGHGWTYEALIGRIVAAAAARWSQQAGPESFPATLPAPPGLDAHPAVLTTSPA